MMEPASEPGGPQRQDAMVFSEGQLRVLVSPIRKELLSAFLLHGPCGVAEAADAVARPVKSVYYHVRAMAAAGLIVEMGSRGHGRDRESLFDAAAQRFLLRTDNRDAPYRALERRSVKALLRLAAREYERASERDLDTFVLRISARLGERDYEEVQRRLRDVIEFVKSKDFAGNERTFSITALTTEGASMGQSKGASSAGAEKASERMD